MSRIPPNNTWRPLTHPRLLIVISTSIFLMTLTVDATSPVVASFKHLIEDMKINLNSIRFTSDIGLLDRTYGYVLGAMLQSTFMLNQLGHAIKKETLKNSDFVALFNEVCVFDDEFHPNYSVYSKVVSGYPRMNDLKQAMKDMEDPFKFKLRYMLRTFLRGNDGLEAFEDYWRSLKADRNGLLQLFQLTNDTSADDFISVWKRNESRCDPKLIRPLFFEIQINVFREFVSREIYQGMPSAPYIRPKMYKERVSKLNLRMMEVMNYCWQLQVKRRAKTAYALYYKSRFNVASELRSLPSFLTILSSLALMFHQVFW